MKKVYILNVSYLNGSVTMGNDISVYEDKKLAEEAMNKIKEINEKNKESYNNDLGISFNFYYEISESKLYENKSEMKIFNDSKLCH